jgi:uncharacterized membrane protein YedE/YeeE
MSSPLDSAGKRLLGLATGLAFGALLQRGRLSRYETILGQLLGKDGRVIKAMGTAVAVGGLGFQLLQRRGHAQPDLKPMKVGGVVGGAALFGAGMALMGYCPGTSVAAVGEGHRDALAGVLGMVAGAAAFVALYPKLVRWLDAGGDLGKVTVTEVLAEPVTARQPGTVTTTVAANLVEVDAVPAG